MPFHGAGRAAGGTGTGEGRLEGFVIRTNFYGNPIQTLQGHTSQITAVAFSPNGKDFLTASLDHTARLWDINGNTIQTFQHKAPVYAVAFHPEEGKQILTGTGDYDFHIFNNMLHELESDYYALMSIEEKVALGTIQVSECLESERLQDRLLCIDYYSKLDSPRQVRLIVNEILKTKPDLISLAQTCDLLWKNEDQALPKGLETLLQRRIKTASLQELKQAADNYLAMGLRGRYRSSVEENIRNYQWAVQFYEAAIERGAQKETKENASAAYYNLSWYLILNEKFEQAEAAARRTLEITPEMTGVYTNIALSLLFKGALEEAKAIYLEWKDRKDHRGLVLKIVFLKDFDDLERAGITHPDVEEIRRLLKE